MMSERSTRSRNSVAALGLAQVQRHGLLVARVHRPEEVMPVEFGLPPGAQRVRRAGRLDLDDLGAHVAEQPARERTRDQGADLDHADAVQRAGDGHSENPCRCSQSVQMPDGLAQRAALVGSGVVVVGAGDLVHLLVRMPDGLEQPAGVAGRAGVVGEVADHQGGHRDVGSALHRVAVGVVVAPLRQPAAQRAEPGEADRAVVHHLRITQIAGSRGAFVGIDRRVQPAGVGHGAVHDERELVVGSARRP